MVEILLSLFLIMAILTIFLVTSGTYNFTRNSSLQGLATKIASRQMESLRNTTFDNLPTATSFTDSDLSKLPNGNDSQSITNYDPDGKIKLVTLQVNWTENGASKNIKLETLISENGL